MDGIKLYKSNKSFTINKEKTFLCLYDKDGNYYPLNMIIYVLLHEIAHSLNVLDVGHTENFHEIFDQLLEEATKMGIYNPSIPIIQDYCNHD
jgi:predicted metal-dependent hydrolase